MTMRVGNDHDMMAVTLREIACILATRRNRPTVPLPQRRRKQRLGGEAMPIPQIGDLLVRMSGAGRFELVDVVTLTLVAGPFDGFAGAMTAARERGVRAIWQQNVDDRGRPLGDPFRLPDA